MHVWNQEETSQARISQERPGQLQEPPSVVSRVGIRRWEQVDGSRRPGT